MPTRNESAISLLIERAAIAPAGRQCSPLAYAVFSETNATVRRAQEVINYTVRTHSGNGSDGRRGKAGRREAPGRAELGSRGAWVARSLGRAGSAGVGRVAGGEVRAAAVQDPDRAFAGHGDPGGVRLGGEPAAEHEPDSLG